MTSILFTIVVLLQALTVIQSISICDNLGSCRYREILNANATQNWYGYDDAGDTDDIPVDTDEPGTASYPNREESFSCTKENFEDVVLRQWCEIIIERANSNQAKIKAALESVKGKASVDQEQVKRLYENAIVAGVFSDDEVLSLMDDANASQSDDDVVDANSGSWYDWYWNKISTIIKAIAPYALLPVLGMGYQAMRTAGTPPVIYNTVNVVVQNKYKTPESELALAFSAEPSL